MIALSKVTVNPKSAVITALLNDFLDYGFLDRHKGIDCHFVDVILLLDKASVIE
jgi:hypothetical protein